MKNITRKYNMILQAASSTWIEKPLAVFLSLCIFVRDCILYSIFGFETSCQIEL